MSMVIITLDHIRPMNLLSFTLDMHYWMKTFQTTSSVISSKCFFLTNEVFTLRVVHQIIMRLLLREIH
jgi:uncharacterized membrane protein